MGTLFAVSCSMSHNGSDLWACHWAPQVIPRQTGTDFTNTVSIMIQIRWPFRIVLINTYTAWSLHDIVRSTATVLPWQGHSADLRTMHGITTTFYINGDCIGQTLVKWDTAYKCGLPGLLGGWGSVSQITSRLERQDFAKQCMWNFEQCYIQHILFTYPINTPAGISSKMLSMSILY